MADTQLIILDEIGARFANITEANGYIFTVEPLAIERARLTPFKTGDLPAINYWPTIDALDFKSGKSETRELSVSVEIYGVTRDEPFTDLSTKMSNTAITALFRSTSAPQVSDPRSLALGGLVEELRIDSATPMIGEGSTPWCGSLLEIAIRYNVLVGDFSTIVKY